MKKLLGMVLVGSLMFTTSAFAFSDVPEGYWAYEKIEEMQKSGIISGFPDGTFKPELPVTREQAAAIMTNFFDLSQKEDERTFEDIPEGYWSEQYARLAGQYMPIIESEGQYYFNPTEDATRIDVAEAIVKILGFNDEEISYEIINNFKDKDAFSESDKKYISIIAENNIMVGDNNSEFRPKATITRSEFCALIYNIYLKRAELKAQNADKTVITVNDEAISYKDFELYFNLQKLSYETMLGGAEIWTLNVDGSSLYEMVKEAVKDSVVSNKVKIQKAKELGVTLSDDEVKQAEAYLETEDAKQICEYYKITTDELLKINLEGMLIEKLGEAIYPAGDENYLNIDTEIDRVYYDVRHILLATEGKTDEEKAEIKVKAEELLNRVLNGEVFATLAGEYSEDIGSKENGGLYENVKQGEFVSEFEAAALATQVGTVYPELVESSYGYHIIKLEKKEIVKEKLTEQEKRELMDKHLAKVSGEWVENANVVIEGEIYKSL